jgi:hypothetical protein
VGAFRVSFYGEQILWGSQIVGACAGDLPRGVLFDPAQGALRMAPPSSSQGCLISCFVGGKEMIRSRRRATRLGPAPSGDMEVERSVCARTREMCETWGFATQCGEGDIPVERRGARRCARGGETSSWLLPGRCSSSLAWRMRHSAPPSTGLQRASPIRCHSKRREGAHTRWRKDG